MANTTNTATYSHIEKLIEQRTEIEKRIAKVEEEHAKAEADIATLLKSMKEHDFPLDGFAGSCSYKFVDRKANATQERITLQRELHEIELEIQGILYWGADYKPTV